MQFYHRSSGEVHDTSKFQVYYTYLKVTVKELLIFKACTRVKQKGIYSILENLFVSAAVKTFFNKICVRHRHL